MEKTNIINYGFEIEILIREQIGKCLLMASDIYLPLETQNRYRMQVIVLKQLLETTKEFTETIKNDI